MFFAISGRKSRDRFAILSVFLVFSFQVSCTRAPDLVGVDNAETPAVTIKGATRQKIFITTTRQATEVVGTFYSGQRAPELGLASVVVSIPPNHVAGNLERAQTLPPDPKTEFAVIEPTVYQTDGAFIGSVNSALSALPREDREILFFVHGYNNTISDSILRLAQFVEDTEFKGVPVLFAWASAAQPSKYVYDLNSAMTARPRFLEAANILINTNAKGANVFAHSMGAFLTMEAIVDAKMEGRFDRSGRLNNIMLAAPDIDIDLFRTQLSALDGDTGKFFVLTSADDNALGFSRRISGGITRVGSANAAELDGLGVTVIDISEIEDSKSGSHSKFAGSPEVVQLIGKGLENSSTFGNASRTTLDKLVADLPITVIRN